MTRVIINDGQYLKTDDTRPALDVQLITGSNTPENLSSVSDVSLLIEASDGTTLVDDNTNGAVSIDDESNGRVSYQWQSSDTQTAQTLEGEFVVDYGSNEATFPNNGRFEVYIEERIQ